jgi:hypothetical protein
VPPTSEQCEPLTDSGGTNHGRTAGARHEHASVQPTHPPQDRGLIHTSWHVERMHEVDMQQPEEHGDKARREATGHAVRMILFGRRQLVLLLEGMHLKKVKRWRRYWLPLAGSDGRTCLGQRWRPPTANRSPKRLTTYLPRPPDMNPPPRRNGTQARAYLSAGAKLSSMRLLCCFFGPPT